MDLKFNDQPLWTAVGACEMELDNISRSFCGVVLLIFNCKYLDVGSLRFLMRCACTAREQMVSALYPPAVHTPRPLQKSADKKRAFKSLLLSKVFLSL